MRNIVSTRIRRRMNDRQAGRWLTLPITNSLFILLVSFAVLGRILQIELVANNMCDPEIFRGRSPFSLSVSLVEWMLIIALLAACLQLLSAITGLLLKTIRVLPIMLGSINLLLSAGLLMSWGQMWAFWHPDEAAGRFISQTAWNLPFARKHFYQSGAVETDRPPFGEDDPDWHTSGHQLNGKPVYVHKATGVINSYELVRSCFPPEIYRANIRMMIAAGRFDEEFYAPDMRDEAYDWILRDSKGAIISRLMFRADPVGYELKRQAGAMTPVPSAQEFFEIVTKEQELRDGGPPDDKTMSLAEFQDAYLCIKEKQRLGEYPSCPASD